MKKNSRRTTTTRGFKKKKQVRFRVEEDFEIEMPEEIESRFGMLEWVRTRNYLQRVEVDLCYAS